MQIKGAQKADVFVSLVQRFAELYHTEGKTMFQKEELELVKVTIERLK